MKTYNEKLSRFLNFVLYGLVILAIAGFIYSIVPKYQMHIIRRDDDSVRIIKINTLTGETVSWDELWGYGGRIGTVGAGE